MASTPSERPTRRLVVAALAVGAAGALAGPLLVAPGAAEHTTTGAALLAFAAAWAILAVLLERRAARPQRWALVPAAAMALTGVGLLVSAPGDSTLDALGWVWPVPACALAAWIIRSAQRQLPERGGRRLVQAVAAVLCVAAAGAAAESVLVTRDHAAPGRRIDVGGRRLHLDCSGTGSPTVVLSNGMGESTSSWAWIAPAVAARTRVCAYDRAGQGWSDDPSSPQDGAAIASDLHALLERAGEHGPYVLAGHSTGGAHALTYAARYPDDLAGLVFLDATSPEAYDVLPDFPTSQAMLRRLFGVAPSLGRIGLGRLVTAVAGGGLPARAQAEADAFAGSARGMRSQHDELARLRTSLVEARALTDLGGKPLAVITATDGQQAGWSAAQDHLATLSSDALHRSVLASHSSLLDDRRDAATSTEAILGVVTSVRTGAPVVRR